MKSAEQKLIEIKSLSEKIATAKVITQSHYGDSVLQEAATGSGLCEVLKANDEILSIINEA